MANSPIRTYVNPPRGYVVPRPKKPAPLPGSLPIAPDYGTIATTDPRYTLPEAGLTAALGHEGDSRAEQIRRALIQYGSAPANYKDVYGDLDPTTLDAARNNPFGVFKQLRDTYDHNLLRSRNSLEARGILNSGLKDVSDQAQGRDYAQAEYSATNSLNDLISQAIAGYTKAGDNYTAEHNNLVDRVRQELEKDTSITNSTGHLVAGSKQRYGVAVYTDAQGNLYTRDPVTGFGKRWTRPAPTRPTGTYGGI